MNTFYKLFLTILVLTCPMILFAQDKPADMPTLLKDGMDLNKAGKFTEAIAKFDEALKIDPTNMDAVFDMGFSLALAQKYTEALPYLEKFAAVNQVSVRPQAYVALANTYSILRNYDKGIYYYTKVLGVLPNNWSVWNSLSSDYMFSNKFAQAQAAAAESIKLNSKQANTYPFYAYSAMNQGKNAEALLGLFNFIMLAPPQEKQTRDACRAIKLILHASPKPGLEPIAKMQQETIAKSMAAATAGKTNLAPADSLTLQLTSVFKAIHEQQDQYNSPFFSKFFGDYFAAMATTDNIDTFSHIITTMLISPAETEAWIKEHPEKINTFVSWIKSTERKTQ